MTGRGYQSESASLKHRQQLEGSLPDNELPTEHDAVCNTRRTWWWSIAGPL